MKQQRDGLDIPDFRNSVVLTDEQCQGLKDAGRQFVIVEYTWHDHFIAQVQQLKRWGFDVSSYNFLYWSRPDGEILTTGFSSAANHMNAIVELRNQGIELGWWRPDGTFMPQVFWDAETDPTSGSLVNPEHDRAVQLLASCVEWSALDQFGKLASGIYTGQYWWQEHMANDQRFATLPLWHASQFEQTVPAPFASYFAGHEYGGWQVPMLWQYRDAPVAGVNSDWNLEEWEAA